MTTRPATDRRKMPTGREEVAAAILQAATDLFAERGPAATSIRDIAARSKVNHGLVFRHFGTKDQLVGAVLDHLGTKLTRLLHSEAPADIIERALDRHGLVCRLAVSVSTPSRSNRQARTFSGRPSTRDLTSG
ncbi:BCGM3439c [Mycobacterium tuberculosis variant bovis BCG str. Moreau RDJ]|nr:BCGM3439c [Mycobacterium tuberculosis variant bovis BCG str. Moreau RDJ]